MLPLTFTAAGEATLLKLLRRPIGGHATPRREPERQRETGQLSVRVELGVICLYSHWLGLAATNTTNIETTHKYDTLSTVQVPTPHIM